MHKNKCVTVTARSLRHSCNKLGIQLSFKASSTTVVALIGELHFAHEQSAFSISALYGSRIGSRSPRSVLQSTHVEQCRRHRQQVRGQSSNRTQPLFDDTEVPHQCVLIRVPRLEMPREPCTARPNSGDRVRVVASFWRCAIRKPHGAWLLWFHPKAIRLGSRVSGRRQENDGNYFSIPAWRQPIFRDLN